MQVTMQRTGGGKQRAARAATALVAAVLLLAAVPGAARAMPQTGHYFSGANGLLSAVPMPAGFTYVNNFFMYNTDTVKDFAGDSIKIGQLDVYVNAFTPVWTSGTKILDATYSCMLLVPLQNVALGNYLGFEKEEYWGVGDILLQPLMLTWDLDGLFLTLRYGFFAPTGRFALDKDDNIGLGYWTHQIVAGATWFFGPNATWHLSALNRIELHTKQSDQDLYPGANMVSEWGFGKTLIPGLDLGITGYANFQIDQEAGTSVNVDNNLYRVFALGGEVSYHIPETSLLVKLRCNKEFAARSHSQGLASAFTLAYHF